MLGWSEITQELIAECCSITARTRKISRMSILCLKRDMLIPCLYDRQSCSRAPDENKLLGYTDVIYTSYQKHDTKKSVMLCATNPYKSFIVYISSLERVQRICGMSNLLLNWIFFYIYLLADRYSIPNLRTEFCFSGLWVHNMCIRYFHCKDTENKLVTCFTNVALKLRKIWDKILSFSSSSLLIFTQNAVYH